ncbi:MAG: DUF4129 domain-containing protein [Chloroflexi bacterium]|nr:DUF4129 domain-containing protein [Chloroflexota bacterium]
MKKIFGSRSWIILLGLVALTGLILLASGLSRLKLDSSQMAWSETIFDFTDKAHSENIPQASWVKALFPVTLIISFLLLLGPMRPMLSKDLTMALLRFFVLIFVVMLIMARPLLEKYTQSSSGMPGIASVHQSFSAPTINSNLEFWITVFVVIIVSAIFLFVLNRIINSRFKPKKKLEEIANIVRSSLNQLSENQDARSTIIVCYQRMISAIKESRGLTRKDEMTPAEFAKYLERAGLPRDGVQRLTHVFEKVRYGAQEIQPDEIKEAKQCLTSILKVCQTQP